VILITLLLLSCSYFIQSSENQVQPPLRERRNFNTLFRTDKENSARHIAKFTSDANIAQQENTDPTTVDQLIPKSKTNTTRPTSAHRSYSPAIMPRCLLFTDDVTLSRNPKTHAATIQQPEASTLLTVAMPDKCQLPLPLNAACPIAPKNSRTISVLRSYSPTIMPSSVATTFHASSETQLPIFHSKPTRFVIINFSDKPSSVPTQKTTCTPNDLQQENNFLKRTLIAAAVAHHGDKKALLESEELQARKNLFALFLAHKRHAARQSSMTNAYSSRYTDNSKFKF